MIEIRKEVTEKFEGYEAMLSRGYISVVLTLQTFP